MKMPKRPPPIDKLFNNSSKDLKKLSKIISLSQNEQASAKYYHWDELRNHKPPEGYSLEEWWWALKIQRRSLYKTISLKDKVGQPFHFCLPDLVHEALHEIDLGAAGSIGMGVLKPVTNPQTRDRYLLRSLMEEAITSSQLEGAATTREVAKEMIRSGRSPQNTDEQMILNNFLTMKWITELKEEPLSPKLVFEIHHLVTDKTLDNPTASGRFRSPQEKCVVGDDYGEVFHEPPPAEELASRLDAMCAFANGKTPDFFVHPVARAIILHFWLAYDHPFVDGNGRTARALFYWGMLKSGYWLFEYISISNILRKAPAQYGLSFLHTETDENDLTYFIIYQVKVILRAIKELHAYIERKNTEVKELESHLRALNLFNHRQAELIRHALKHPYQHYTIETHRMSHDTAYQTARADLLDLQARSILIQKKQGKKMVFFVPRDLAARLRKLEKENIGEG